MGAHGMAVGRPAIGGGLIEHLTLAALGSLCVELVIDSALPAYPPALAWRTAIVLGAADGGGR